MAVNGQSDARQERTLMSVRDNPGKRNRKVVVQKPTQATTLGKTVTTWADVGIAWVQIETLTSFEYWEAKRQAADITHKITGLFHDFENVTADMRIKLNTRVFNISEPPRDVEEAHVVYKMMCMEEVR